MLGLVSSQLAVIVFECEEEAIAVKGCTRQIKFTLTQLHTELVINCN